MAKKKRKNRDALRVFGWQADDGGCGQERIEAPLDTLNRLADWSCSHSSWLNAQDLHEHRYDLVIGQRTSSPEAFQLWQALVNPLGPATIYEVDDFLFGVEPTNRTAHEFFSMESTQRIMATSLYLADAVTVSCEPLKEALSQFNPNIYVIPNYQPKRYLQAPRRATSADVVVGYGGGSSHTLDILANVAGIRSAMAANEHVTFRNYGQNFAQEFALPRFEYVPWQKQKRAYMESLRLDVGICPLRDTQFNRCKTSIKALEYAMKGVPCVASNVTPYKEFVVDGVTGFLVDTAEEWHDALHELVNNPDLRYELGCNAYELACAWTLEGHIDERAAIYEQVISIDRDAKHNKWRQVKAAMNGEPFIPA